MMSSSDSAVFSSHFQIRRRKQTTILYMKIFGTVKMKFNNHTAFCAFLLPLFSFIFEDDFIENRSLKKLYVQNSV